MLVVEVQQEVRAHRADVWHVVADVRRQPEYVGYGISLISPTTATDMGLEYQWRECGVILGKPYDCQCRVFGWEPPEWVCFGSKDVFHVSFELTPRGTATLITYRVELPQARREARERVQMICRRTLSNLRTVIEVSARAFPEHPDACPLEPPEQDLPPNIA
jgi:hypothetical protein